MKNAISGIFISYAREDQETALSIYTYLKSHGYSPWLDIKNLFAGQDWKTEIDKAIRDSHIFLACLSNKSVSKRGYVQAELKKALEVLDTIPEDEVYLIPIRLEDCVVPSQLSRFHWLDYYKPQGKKNLLKTIQQHFDASRESQNNVSQLPKSGSIKSENLKESSYRAINIFLTFGIDASQEGQIAEEVIVEIDQICRSSFNLQTKVLEWSDLLPLIPPKTDNEFQNDALQELTQKCDVFVLILNRRFGSVSPGEQSDIERQVESVLNSIANGRSIAFLPYFRKFPTNIDPGQQEYKMLDLQRRIQAVGLPKQIYENTQEFRQTFFQNLYDLILSYQKK